MIIDKESYNPLSTDSLIKKGGFTDRIINLLSILHFLNPDYYNSLWVNSSSTLTVIQL